MVPQGSTALAGWLAKLAVALLVAACLATPSVAAAGNLRSFLLGNEAAMTAGAGVALMRGSDAAWYNPAGIGGPGRRRISASGTAFQLRHYQLEDGLAAVLPSGTYVEDIVGLSTGAVPTAVATSWGLTPRVDLGFGVFVTQSETLDLRLDMSRRETVEGLSTIFEGATTGRGEYGQVTEVYSDTRTYHIGPAVAFEPIPSLRLGLSLLVVYASAHETHRFGASFEAEGLEDVRDIGVSILGRASPSSVGLLLKGGLQWEVAPGWHLGLVLQSPTFAVYRWGESVTSVSFAVPAQADDGSWTVATAVEEEVIDLERLGFDMVAPFEGSLSFGYSDERFWIGVEGAVAHPLGSSAYDVERGWLWNVAVGSRFRITEAIAGGVGLFTDMSPRESPLGYGTGRVDYFGVALGGEYRTAFSLSSGEEAEPLVFSTVLALRYAFGIGSMDGLTYEFLGSGEGTPEGADARRRMLAHEASVHLGSGIHF